MSFKFLTQGVEGLSKSIVNFTELWVRDQTQVIKLKFILVFFCAYGIILALFIFSEEDKYRNIHQTDHVSAKKRIILVYISHLELKAAQTVSMTISVWAETVW